MDSPGIFIAVKLIFAAWAIQMMVEISQSNPSSQHVIVAINKLGNGGPITRESYIRKGIIFIVVFTCYGMSSRVVDFLINKLCACY